MALVMAPVQFTPWSTPLEKHVVPNMSYPPENYSAKLVEARIGAGPLGMLVPPSCGGDYSVTMRGTRFIGMLLGLTILGTACGVMAAPSPHHGGSASKPLESVNNTKNHALSGKPNRAKVKKVTSTSSMGPGAATIRRGAMLFRAECAVCHGPAGIGTHNAPRLAAPTGVVNTFKTEASLVAFISSQMPADHPGSLTHQQAREVGSYVWHIAEAK